MTKLDYLIAIQSELKAPKNQFNGFGKYKYRSAEDILEAIKPLLKKYKCWLTITEATSEKAGFLVLTSTATLTNGTTTISVNAEAGVNPNRKGMDIAQSFGASSSYAKKYALGNLFLLDDTKDADSNKEQQPTAKKLTDKVFTSMIVAIGEGKGLAVKQRLADYVATEEQILKINNLINKDLQKQA